MREREHRKNKTHPKRKENKWKDRQGVKGVKQVPEKGQTAANFNAPPGQRRLAKEPSQRKQQTDKQTETTTGRMAE